MNWVIFACYFYACAGISSKTTVLWLLLSLFSPSLMHAVCPAALTAKAATTAIDNKRRAPSTSPSSLALSLSLPLRLWHFTFRFMNGDNDEEAAESKRPKNTRHIFIYAKYTREETNVGRGMKQNQVKYTKIKWQKSKVLLLYSLSLSFSIARFVLFSISVWLLVLFDTTRRQSISFIHDSWIGVESFSHFFASVFVAVVGNSRRRRRQIKCQKNFTIVFSVTLYLHTQLIYACFLLFLFIICDVFFYCVLNVCVCVCLLSHMTQSPIDWQIPFKLATAFT